MNTSHRPMGRFFYCLISVLLCVSAARGYTGPALTTVSDVIYRADGTTATGTLIISWKAFATADGKAVPAGEMSVALSANGALSVALAPNEGATPEGSYYKVVYKLNDGATSTEYWTVPAAGPTTVAAIRAVVVPKQVAVALGGGNADAIVKNPTAAQTISGGFDLVLSGALKPDVASRHLGESGQEWQGYFSSIASAGISDSGTIAATNLTVSGSAATAGISDSGVSSFKNLNGARFADRFTGADACAKIAAAMADLPSTGGIVDARGLEGAQSCSSNPFTGVAVPVTLMMGKTTLTSSVGWSLPSNARMIGQGRDKSKIVFSGTIATAIDIGSTSSDVEITGLWLNASAKTVTRGVYIHGFGAGQNVHIHDNKFSGFGDPASGNQGAVALFNTQDVWIEHNEFTDNGVGVANGTSAAQNAFDIGVNGSAGLGIQKRLHILNNYIHDSLTTINMQLFDTSESEVSHNWIDQNNVIWTTPTSTGYGIMFYEDVGSLNPPIRNRIEDNHIQNTAGYAIYHQGGYGSAIIGNTTYNTVQQMTDGGSLGPAAIKVNSQSPGTGLGAFTVSGNTVDTSLWYGIEVTGGTTGTVVNANTIRNIDKYAVFLGGSETNLSIANNIIDTVGVGIYGNGTSTGVSVIGNAIRNYGNGTSNKGGIYIPGAVTGWTIAGNTISGAVAGQAIIFVNGSATSNTISGNTINAAGGTAANAIDYRGLLPTITGNTVRNATTNGIQVSGTSSGGSVADNVITGSAVYGISVSGTTPTVALGKNYFASNAIANINPASVVSDYPAAGTKTLSGGAGTVTFPVVYTSAPICTCTDQTAAAAVKCSTTATTLTIAGTAADSIAYACFGNPN